jgi:two-component system, NtrC family, sensor kinase
LSERILIVDDDQSVLNVTGRWARLSGYEGVLAESAEEALEILDGAEVDLVITDLKLPGMDGLSLAQKLLDADPDRPVMLMTGFADLDSARQAVTTGIHEYFVKPFDLDDVGRSVGRAPQYRRTLAENRDYQESLAQKVDERTCELVELNAELEQQRVRSVEADRLHSLGEMAAGVAHELNQPLNGIRTFSEGIIYGMDNGWEVPANEVRETLEDIVQQVDRMTTIIDHMREFARDSAESDPVIFHVFDAVENALKLVGAQLKVHGILLVVDVPEDLPRCKGWPNLIEQALLNLISNARDAMDVRSKGAREKRADVSPGWRPILSIRAVHDVESGWVRTDISDTGGGIPEASAAGIFDPFFTTKEVGEGTGLGLSISRNLVERHGGRLELANHPGDGATFTIVLPSDESAQVTRDRSGEGAHDLVTVGGASGGRGEPDAFVHTP